MAHALLSSFLSFYLQSPSPWSIMDPNLEPPPLKSMPYPFYFYLFIHSFIHSLRKVIFSLHTHTHTLILQINFFSHLSLSPTQPNPPPHNNNNNNNNNNTYLFSLSLSLPPISMDPQTLSPRRRNTNDCNSPEFEFWMLRNPSFPQPDLLSADELFVDGVLLPLHLLPSKAPNSDPPAQDPDPEPDSQPDSSPAITDTSSSSVSTSKRWKDLFRKGEKKNNNTEEKEKEKDKEKKKKKERKTGSGTGSATAELNINIWPFSRSRSAGNTTTRPKFFPGAPTRKVNSAPCSRSNSTGESKSKKWPSSPGRAGVHVGRASPVWQVRRSGSKNSEPQSANNEKGLKRETTATRRSKVVSGTGKARVLNLNVPMCIGYRHNLSCKSENSAVGVSGVVAATNGGECHDGGSGGNIFNLRNLFNKKSIVTSH